MRIRDSYAWIIVLLAPFFFMSTAFAGWIDQCDGNGGGTTQNSVLDRCPSGIGGYLRAPAGAVFCTTNSSAAGYCYYGPAGKTTRQALDAGKLGCVDGGVGQNTCTRRTTDEADCINRVPNCSSSSSSSAPDAPSSLSAVAGNQKIDLSWNSVSGATSYQVMRRTSPGGTYSTVASNVTNTSYTNSGLTNGTTYYYIVRAKKAKLLSDDSPEASATPIAAKSIDYGPIVVNANINSKLDNRRERLIQFLGSDGKPVVASVDYVPNASYESIGVAYFPTGTTASFIRDVHPKTITSMQFTFADVELRRAMTAGIIKKNTGNITIKENGVVIKNIPISSPFITISPEEEGYNDFNYPPQFNTFWYPYSRDISIDFAGLGIVLKNDASYTISMDRGILKNSAQNDALSKAFTVSFKTGHPISFSTMTPINGATNLDPLRTTRAVIVYNGPLNWPTCKLLYRPPSSKRFKEHDDVHCNVYPSESARPDDGRVGDSDLVIFFSKGLLPDTSYSVQITNLTDNYAAHDPVPVPNEWKFSTGPIQCTYGGSGDGTGSFTDKAKQKACRALKVNFLCSKVFGCSWDGTQCNRSFACVAGKPAANATDVFCARYADDQVGCEKFQSCRYSDGVCSKR